MQMPTKTEEKMAIKKAKITSKLRADMYRKKNAEHLAANNYQKIDDRASKAYKIWTKKIRAAEEAREKYDAAISAQMSGNL